MVMDFRDFMSTPNGPIPHEPSADFLGLAQMNYEIYTSHLKAGFSEMQALQLTGVAYGTLLTNAYQNPNNDGGSNG